MLVEEHQRNALQGHHGGAAVTHHGIATPVLESKLRQGDGRVDERREARSESMHGCRPGTIPTAAACDVQAKLAASMLGKVCKLHEVQVDQQVGMSITRSPCHLDATGLSPSSHR